MECFAVTIKDHIAHVVLNRPDKRNSMNPAFWRELPELINDINDNAKARVIVISSTGPHFTSGLDVSAFAGGGSGESMDAEAKKTRQLQAGTAFYENVLSMQEAFNCLENARIPVLVAIQGGCIGGGVDFISACDMRYATEDAFITVFETNIGMTADVGTFPRLVKLIPEGYVREMAYTGRKVTAREAQQMGLINQIYTDEAAMLDGVMAIAREIASKAPLAVFGCKKMINYARDHSTQDGLDYIAIWNASHLKIEEIQEAMQANAEKRPGNFVDLPVKAKR
jgi:enoyl-CoA hydratase